MWLQRCCRKVLPHLGFQVSWQGAAPATGLLISNHLSYMDILAFSSIAPCCFLSKIEVRNWPVFGLMAQTGGTIFLDRKSAPALMHANEELSALLSQGVLVVVFPEGTTSDGSSVLPFHASLLQAAVKSEVPLTPAYITYSVSDGSLAEDVCFWRDMTLLPHLWNLLSKPTLQAYVSFAPTERGFQSRKEASERMRAQVIALEAAHKALRQISSQSQELQPGQGRAASRPAESPDAPGQVHTCKGC
ncbi:MAG TPA: 1-acyl-sn-glycerol-3-phosphate acyltransferase [Terriglobales bacterium]|nr:1-acyl-sn-glycerol-3-phosphate acyltransferase [Terriglobales bacterium]